MLCVELRVFPVDESIMKISYANKRVMTHITYVMFLSEASIIHMNMIICNVMDTLCVFRLLQSWSAEKKTSPRRWILLLLMWYACLSTRYIVFFFFTSYQTHELKHILLTDSISGESY